MTASAPPAAELRLGLIGFGKLARDYYLPALHGLPGARVVGVADPLPASHSVARQRLPGVALFSGHRAMLDGVGLDAVLIASPPSTHLQVWSEATARGLAVFVDKPLLLSGQLDNLADRDVQDDPRGDERDGREPGHRGRPGSGYDLRRPARSLSGTRVIEDCHGLRRSPWVA